MIFFIGFLAVLTFTSYGRFAFSNSVPRLPLSKSGPTKHSGHFYDQKGGVASQSARCSRIGANLIEKNGNAADAVSREVSRAWKDTSRYG